MVKVAESGNIKYRDFSQSTAKCEKLKILKKQKMCNTQELVFGVTNDKVD